MYGYSNPTIRTTDDSDIIGPKMHSAVKHVGWNDSYASKNALATTVGPHGSQNYGYRIVDRCLRKGLLTLDSDHDNATPQGLGAVVLTDKGRRYLDRNSDLDVVVDPIVIER